MSNLKLKSWTDSMQHVQCLVSQICHVWNWISEKFCIIQTRYWPPTFLLLFSNTFNFFGRLSSPVFCVLIFLSFSRLTLTSLVLSKFNSSVRFLKEPLACKNHLFLWRFRILFSDSTHLILSLKPNSCKKVFFSHSNYLPDKFY